jgi:hypothetical protein
MTFALEPTDRLGLHESKSADTDVWLTPPHILKPLGKFDLDPCAAMDRPWDTAAVHYTKIDNGLLLPWRGRVWLNPPYGLEASKWLKRLANHGIGTALIFARTDTSGFFDWVWNAASAVLFLRGRLKFHYPNGRQCAFSAGAPSVLIAYGESDAEILRDCGHAGKYIRI